MKTLSAHIMRILLAAVASIFVMTLAASAADLPPGVTESGKVDPVIAGIQIGQIGGDRVLVRLRGYDITHPETVSTPGEGKLVLRWSGVRFPQSTDKRDWWDNYDWDVMMLSSGKSNTWWKQYDLPLLSRVSSEPDGESGMLMSFSSSRPLVVDKIEGAPGADSIAIMLKVYGADDKPKKPAAPKPMASNDPMAIKSPVTLQIRDGDVKSVFRMLADQQRINLLLDPSVPDMTVTFSFKDIPFSEAFGYLLRMTDLNYSMVGSTLVIGRTESLGKTLGKEVVRGYKLSYAVTEKGEPRGDLTAALTNLVSLSTMPTMDARNRTLYVTATEEQHRQIEALLEKLDQPGKQVMLQARIVEVIDDGRQELEALVSAVYNQWLVNFSGNGLGLGYNASNSGFEGTGIQFPTAGRVPGSSSTWGNILPDSGLNYLSAGLRALETKGKGKVLANPSVITLDGQQARVQLTSNYKYVSGTDSNGNSTFSDVESGPRLSFTPVIGRNGIITIAISIETGEIVQFRNAGNGAQAPETTSRKVETVVRVRDTEPFAVGGLFLESKTTNRSRIPVLGYIPLLGDLFTMRSDKHTKSEVAMIVIPYILDVPDSEIAPFDLDAASLGQ